jgi:uncharacterized protein (DUF2235 family)
MQHDEPQTDRTSSVRQLVVLCDGTNNSVDKLGLGTNVLQLARCFDLHDHRQTVFYDPGVGSAANAPGATWVDKIRQHGQRLWSLAFGDGVFDNIAQAYAFLMREYQPGDEIYIFGFSRGAFTARGVAGMVNQFGILAAHNDNLLPLVLNTYFAQTGVARNKAAADIRRIAVPAERSNVAIHFIGVWDTVATIGIPPLDRQFSAPPTLVDWDASHQCWKPKKFIHVRQALALDEHRTLFAPRQYESANFASNEFGQSLVQRWFPGSHCDTGGIYMKAPAISDAALRWVWQEACSKGLRARTPELPPLLATAPVLVHSTLYDNPLWAIGGMRLRKPHTAWATDVPALGPDAPALRYPQDTVWSRDRRMNAHRQPRRWATLAVAAAACLLLYLAMGWAVAGLGYRDVWHALAWQQAAHAPSAFALWQLSAFAGGQALTNLPDSANLKTALLLDFGFIAAYAYLLGRLMSRAFANLAGLTTLKPRPARWLNILGAGLTVAVVADVLENSASMLLLATGGAVWPVVTGLLAWGTSLGAVAKLTGLAMCAALLVWGGLKRHQAA